MKCFVEFLTDYFKDLIVFCFKIHVNVLHQIETKKHEN